MKYFKLTISKGGKKSETVVESPDKNSAMNDPKNRKLGTIIAAKELKQAPLDFVIKKSLIELKNSTLGKKKVPLDDLVPAFKQLSMMLGAGISIHRCLADLIEFSDNRRLREIFTEALNGINGGKTLMQSFSPFAPELGNLTVTMIDLGEQTGNLSETLGMLVKTLEEIRENIAKFKKATRYPMMVMIAMAGAFIFLINMIVPKFKSIFDKLGADLPLPTKILLGIEYAFANYGLLMVLCIVGAIFGVSYYYKNNEAFRKKFDTQFLKVYLLGEITYISTINRYLTTLSLLLKAGLPVEAALKSSLDTVDNLFLKERFAQVQDAIRKGVNLTNAYKNIEIIEPSAIQMISAGEQSGNLDEMIGIAGNYYKVKYNRILDNLSAYIEPIMTAIIAALVTLLALGIFMPMWDMMKAAKGG